jgi:hypothetical protein
LSALESSHHHPPCDLQEDEGDVLYLISNPKKSEEERSQAMGELQELAKEHDMKPHIVKTEWLLFVAMAPFVHWEPINASRSHRHSQ